MCFKPSPAEVAESSRGHTNIFGRRVSRNTASEGAGTGVPAQPRSRSRSTATATTSTGTGQSGQASSQQSKISSTTSTSSSIASVREQLQPENPNLYIVREIADATKQFTAGKLGSSSRKCTLRGKLSVVTARRMRRPLAEAEFKSCLRLVCAAHHTSLVQSTGACYEPDRSETLYQIYDFINGSSLADCLHGGHAPGYTALSTWLSRMQVAVDVAQGLEYLHHDSSVVDYVHNAVKPSAILVTEPGFRARLCHVGLSYLAGEYEAAGAGAGAGGGLVRSNSFRIAGTPGYMAPEMRLDGRLTRAGDVYAFGVVLLELLSGRPPVRFVQDRGDRDRREALVDTVTHVLDGGGGGVLRRWMDPRLKDSFPVMWAERVVRIAVACVDADPARRPDMRYVAGEMSAAFLQSQEWAQKMELNRGAGVSTSIAFQGR